MKRYDFSLKFFEFLLEIFYVNHRESQRERELLLDDIICKTYKNPVFLYNLVNGFFLFCAIFLCRIVSY